jgi:hypothetical protein
MTHATMTQAPGAYGTAFRQVYATAAEITAEQRDQLSKTWELADTAAYAAASKRLDEAIDLLDVERVNFYSPALISDTVYAVLALDRGLITRTDFEAITGAWTLAGLPLPMQLDGDEAIPSCANIDFVTTDALVDELLHATFGTDQYGAVLMLTGYNYGELLAYRSVRACLDRRGNGDFIIDWKSLSNALDGDEADEDTDVDEMEEKAADAIEVALGLLPAGTLEDDDATEGEDDSLLGFVGGDANAEPFVTAVAYSFGVQHLLTGTESAAVVPQPRAWEPSA